MMTRKINLVSRPAGFVPHRPDDLDGIHGRKAFAERSEALQGSKSFSLALLLSCPVHFERDPTLVSPWHLLLDPSSFRPSIRSSR